MIRKLGAGIWLPTLVLCWGSTSIGMGFVKTWEQLLGCRIILGVLEVKPLTPSQDLVDVW